MKKSLWLVLVIFTAVLLVAAVNRKTGAYINEVEISVKKDPINKNFIGEDDIKKQILKGFGNSIRGILVKNLEIKTLEEVVETNPFVKKANVFIDVNNNLHIEVTQRQPVLRIIDNSGSDYYLDEEGKKMPFSKLYSARVLIATGSIPPYTPDFLQKENYTLNSLYRLCNLIDEDEFLRPLIAQVHIDRLGEFLLIPILGNQKILLGNLNEIDHKMSNLKRFYKKVMPVEGWNKYSLINLKFRGQVVCKKIESSN